MNNKSLIEYLKTYDLKSEISFIIGNPNKEVREIYPVKNMSCITDMGNPCIFIEVDKGNDMDEENLMHTTLEDQISINDFIGG